MCRVVLEVSFWDAQFIAGGKKPRIVVPLRSCNETGKYGLSNQSRFSVSTTAPTSHGTDKFDSLNSPMSIFRHVSTEDIPICIGKFRRIKGVRADDSSAVFVRLGKQIGRECAVKQPDQCS